jgi:hypothetical protein
MLGSLFLGSYSHAAGKDVHDLNECKRRAKIDYWNCKSALKTNEIRAVTKYWIDGASYKCSKGWGHRSIADFLRGDKITPSFPLNNKKIPHACYRTHFF